MHADQPLYIQSRVDASRRVNFSRSYTYHHLLYSPALYMARKRVPQSEDDYSDHSDDAYEPGPSQVPKVRRAKHTVKRRKHTSSVLADVSDGSKSGIMSEDVSLSRSHTITVHTITEVEPLREALLDWYAGVHETRGMPWRKPYDPSLNDDERAQRAYEVWISEIMLQQTQVATVIPYYTRWMARYVYH